MFLTKITDIIFPRRCPACHDAVYPRGALICSGHEKLFSYITGPVCMRCGKEIMDKSDEYCGDCRGHERSFDSSAAVLNYDHVAQQSMIMFKFKGRREYARFYAELIYRRAGSRLKACAPELLIPVPIHPARLAQRGYNQAAEIGMYLAPLLGIPMRGDILVRSRRTDMQKTLGSSGRERNLEGAFTAVNDLRGLKRVLVLDDIYTTGSTLDACAAALKSAGAEQVYGCTLCIGRNS